MTPDGAHDVPQSVRAENVVVVQKRDPFAAGCSVLPFQSAALRELTLTPGFVAVISRSTSSL